MVAVLAGFWFGFDSDLFVGVRMSNGCALHLRNEFHFSGVHGAMNRSGSRAK